MSNIAIIDYGMGNCKSVVNMLRKIGVGSIIASEPSALSNVCKIILPGVGAFDNAMKRLQEKKFLEPLKNLIVNKNVPILGICLGMQLFADKSEEGVLPGLGLIPGEVKHFDFTELKSTPSRLLIPHMGWNIVKPTSKKNPLFQNISTPMRFYFVHSFHFVCKNPENIIGITNYGYNFPSAIKKGNIYGVQFHPEKSHKFGMQLLKNFAEL